MSEEKKPSVGAAGETDLEMVGALLDQCGLPFEDLTEAHLEHYLLLRTEKGGVVGSVGLEIFGPHALLRSLAVAEGHRGQRLASLLTDSIESYAAERGVQNIFLLTETAEGFFAARGYEVVPRAALPPQVAESEEVRGLCPDSALSMFLAVGE